MARGRKKHSDKSVYRSLAMVSQFGLNMLVPICLMSALGIWLDGKLGTSYWMVILFFVGAIAGGQNVFRMAKQIYASGRPESGGAKISTVASDKTTKPFDMVEAVDAQEAAYKRQTVAGRGPSIKTDGRCDK